MELFISVSGKAGGIEDRAYQLVRYNYSLEHGNIKFSQIKKAALSAKKPFTKEEVESEDFLNGVDSAMREIEEELQAAGASRIGTFLSNK